VNAHGAREGSSTCLANLGNLAIRCGTRATLRRSEKYEQNRHVKIAIYKCPLRFWVATFSTGIMGTFFNGIDVLVLQGAY